MNKRKSKLLNRVAPCFKTVECIKLSGFVYVEPNQFVPYRVFYFSTQRLRLAQFFGWT